jgi:hypothetical protein
VGVPILADILHASGLTPDWRVWRTHFRQQRVVLQHSATAHVNAGQVLLALRNNAKSSAAYRPAVSKSARSRHPNQPDSGKERAQP